MDPKIFKSYQGCQLMFQEGQSNTIRFLDVDLDGDVDTRRSTNGYIYTIGGIIGNCVSRL